MLMTWTLKDMPLHYTKKTHKQFMRNESIARCWRYIRWPSVKKFLTYLNIIKIWWYSIFDFANSLDTHVNVTILLGLILCIFRCTTQSEDKNLNSRNKVKYLSQVINHSIEYLFIVLSFWLLCSNVIRSN